MRVICTQENLKNGLTYTNKIISSSVTLPILNTVLIKTEQGQLNLSSTNLEVGISITIRCKTEEEGSVCVPAKPLLDVVNSLQNKNLELYLQGNELVVKSEKTQIKLKTLPTEEFPIIPTIEKPEKILLPANIFKHCLNQVVFSAANNTTQPEISGLLIKTSPEELKMAATDRYRLAEVRHSINLQNHSRTIILPQKTAHEVLRILGDSQEELEILLSDTQFAISFKNIYLISRLIEGNYPDYEAIIPKNFNTFIRVPKKLLEQALKTVSIFSEHSSGVKLLFIAEQNLLKITAISENYGEGFSEIDAEILGESGEIVFNYLYLTDFLAVIANEQVEIKITDSSHPALLTSPNNPNHQYMVMPIST